MSGTDMDEVQEAIYRLRFREAFLENKGTEFQDWFVRLAGYAFGSDFEAVRPYGSQGDLKCDGRRVSTGTIFQCYAPYMQSDSELNKKIDEDFRGAGEHWSTWMAESEKPVQSRVAARNPAAYTLRTTLRAGQLWASMNFFPHLNNSPMSSGRTCSARYGSDCRPTAVRTDSVQPSDRCSRSSRDGRRAAASNSLCSIPRCSKDGIDRRPSVTWPVWTGLSPVVFRNCTTRKRSQGSFERRLLPASSAATSARQRSCEPSLRLRRPEPAACALNSTRSRSSRSTRSWSARRARLPVKSTI